MHIFVGVYDGLVDVVKPFAYELDARRAWSDYTEADYAEFENDNEILFGSKHQGSKIYFLDSPLSFYDSSRKIAIFWGIDDVQNVRPDLTEEQAMDVLERVKSKHDATIGVSWDTLEIWADELFPKQKEGGNSHDNQ